MSDREHPEWDGIERRDEPATTGAQEQIDEIVEHVEDMRRRLIFGLRAMAVAGFLFVASVITAVIVLLNVATDASTAATDASNAVAVAERERSERADSVAGVIELFCDIDNVQDTTLADLVEVSIGSGDSSFGEGIDLSALSEFDLAVLASIAKVQELQATIEGGLSKVFREKLAELRDLTPCGRIVALFLAAEDVPTLDELEAERVEKVKP